ncbi:DcaP family trimeric outer membrane transporter [Planctomycetes bacterium CA13]|uniref:DcaP family trimeric outer membrane transporter n=1 Tax=Novipirellula herctigrandis TaxID=2527986 RepID=UPI0011B6C069
MRILAFSIAVFVAQCFGNVHAQVDYLLDSSRDEQATFQSEVRQEIADLESRLSELKSTLSPVSVTKPAQRIPFDDAATVANSSYECFTDCKPLVANDWRGSFPGSIRIPGSPVSAKIGGFVRVDSIHDFDAIGSRDNFDTSTIFTDGRDGESTRFHARSTRLNLDVRWPVYGSQLRAFVEGDFFSENDAFRLRHAYAEWGPWVVGRTWTAFTDINALPYTVDFESPAAFVLARRATVRWTHQLEDRWSTTFAVEDPRVILPRPEGFEGDLSFDGQREPWPDVVSRIRYEGPNGEHQFAGIIHFVGFQSGVAPIQTETGWGLAWSGYSKLFERQRLSYEIEFGTGIGNLKGLPEAVPNPFGGIDLLDLFGATVGYEYKWTEHLSSNLVYSFGQTNNAPLVAGDTIKNTTYVAANLVWRPSQRLEVGGEYLFGRLEKLDGASGKANRIQMSVRWFLP